MGVDTFIRAWIEQDDILRTRCMRILSLCCGTLFCGRHLELTMIVLLVDRLKTSLLTSLMDHGLTSQPFFGQFQEEDRAENIRYAGDTRSWRVVPRYGAGFSCAYYKTHVRTEKAMLQGPDAHSAESVSFDLSYLQGSGQEAWQRRSVYTWLVVVLSVV